MLPFEQVCVCVLHVQEVCEELTHNRGCIHCNEKRKGGERVREMWRESGKKPRILLVCSYRAVGECLCV